MSMKVLLGVPSPCECAPGLVENLIEEVLDEFAYPPGQEDLWAGMFLCGVLMSRQDILDKLPKWPGTDVPMITPETVKIGILST